MIRARATAKAHHMAVTQQTPINSYTANGVTTVFAFAFLALLSTDLVVKVFDTSGNSSTKVLNADYTVSGAGVSGGGTITFAVAPLAGYLVVVYRSTALARAVDYQNNGDLLAATVNADFDRLWLALQEGYSLIGTRAIRAPLGEVLPDLPPAATRANYLLAFDALGNPTTAAAVSGSATALAIDIANTTSPTKGAGQIGFGYALAYAAGTIGRWLQDLATSAGASFIGFLQTGTGAVLRSLQSKSQDIVSVFDFMTSAQIADVSTGAQTLDVGPAIRVALATGKPLRFPAGTYITDYDPASAFNDGGTTRYAYSLKIPSNAVLIFEDGAVIKQKAGAQKWTRTVNIESVSGVKIFGELRVDANVANIGVTTNEQMHGIFIFNATDVYIERINSQNARGDNVFIGGTDENTYSSNVTIVSLRSVKAGRKNLTLHYCNALSIGIADLDNSTGGAAIYSGGVADTTNRHSLDVEPDTYTGARRFEQSIGRLKTYGMGNDLTAGTTPTQADNWIVNIGTADCVQSASSATIPAWEQNGVTVNVGSLRVSGVAGNDAAFRLNYAARLVGDSLSISGATATSAGFLLQTQASGGDENRPKLAMNRVELVASTGSGIDARSAIMDIGVLDAKCAGFAAQFGESVTSASYRGSTVIGHLVTRDTGVATTGAVLNLTTYSITGYQVTIKSATLLDTRGSKVGYFAAIASGNAQGLCIGELVNTESIPVCNYAGTDKYYRLAGGPWSTTPRSPGQFVCTGTPEAMVPAAIGSIAQRDDGGAGTSLYVKQSGTGNTGWVGK